MPRPSVIPQVRERLEAYLNDRETAYQAQSADQKAATLPSTPDGKINVRAVGISSGRRRELAWLAESGSILPSLAAGSSYC